MLDLGITRIRFMDEFGYSARVQMVCGCNLNMAYGQYWAVMPSLKQVLCEYHTLRMDSEGLGVVVVSN